MIAVGYTVIFSAYQSDFITANRNIGAGDFAQYIQYFWKMSRFRMPVTTITAIGPDHRPGNAFRNHMYPIIFLLAPVYILFPHYNTLLVISTASVSLSSLLVYIISVKETRKYALSFLLSVSFLTNPLIIDSFRWGFRPNSLAILFLLLAFYSIRLDRTVWYFIFIALSLACAEYNALFTAFLGLYICLSGPPARKRVGLITIAISAVYFIIASILIIPCLSGAGGYLRWSYIDDFQIGINTRIFLSLHHPRIIKIFTPLTILPFISPGILFVVPALALYFVCLFTYNTWHFLVAVTFVYIAGILGAKKLHWGKNIHGLFLAVTAILIGLVNIYPLRNIVWPRPNSSDYRLPAISNKHIPKDSTVLTQDMLLPHFADRETVRVLHCGRILSPGEIEDLDCDYIVVGFYRPFSLDEIREIVTLIDFIQITENYQVVHADNGYALLKKSRSREPEYSINRLKTLSGLNHTLNKLVRYWSSAPIPPGVLQQMRFNEDLAELHRRGRFLDAHPR